MNRMEDKPVKTVGSELLNEIERVSAKRERWRGYGMGNVVLPAIMLMTNAIDRGKRAVQSDDPAEAIAALQSLRDFYNED